MNGYKGMCMSGGKFLKLVSVSVTHLYSALGGMLSSYQMHFTIVSAAQANT